MHFNYSTADVSGARRLDYWAESVCKRLIPAAGKFSPQRDFQGSLTGHTLGNLTLCRMSSQPHTFDRTPHHVRVAPEEDFVAVLMQEGTALLQQGGREVQVRPGDIVLYDAARPFVHHLAPASALLVRMPRQQLLSRFARAEAMATVRIAEGRSMATLLMRMAEEAFDFSAGGAPDAAGARLAGAFLDTLTAAMEMQDSHGTDGAQGSRYGSAYQRASQYIDAHLDDSALDSDGIAAAVHLSARTLARVFATHGTTVMHHVWKRRLDAAFRVLNEGRVHQVSQAALQCGFNDLSHFSRAFRNAFGMTPSSLLPGAAGAAAGAAAASMADGSGSRRVQAMAG
jgi:AraC-like DNA-binding protein